MKKHTVILFLVLTLLLPTTACAPTDTDRELADTADVVMKKEHRLYGKRTVEAYTVDEFLAAIAPDTSVLLMDGAYNLSDASDYGSSGGEYYTWNPVDGGYELVIENAENLYISGISPEVTTVTTDCAAAALLRFSGCNNVIVQTLAACHSDPDGTTGDGIHIQDSENVWIIVCDICQCATGVAMEDCNHIFVELSEIHHCSSAAAAVEQCTNIYFRDMEEIRDCPEEYLVDADSSNVELYIDRYP